MPAAPVPAGPSAATGRSARKAVACAAGMTSGFPGRARRAACVVRNRPGRGAQARAQARLPRGGLGARAEHAVEPVPEPLERAGVEQREAVGDRLHGRSDALQRDVQPVGPQAHRERIGGHEPQRRAEGVGLGRAHARPHAGGGRRRAHLADGPGAAVERRERQRRAPHRHPVLVRGDCQIEPGDVNADQHQGDEMLCERMFDCKRPLGCRCRLGAASALPPPARRRARRRRGRDRHRRAPAQPAGGPGRRARARSSSPPGRCRRASRALEPLAPSLPDGGPNGAAIWVHGDRSPAAAVALFRAAGIPASVVRTLRRGPAPPARPELADDELRPRGLRAQRAGLRAPRRHVPRRRSEPGGAGRHRRHAHRLLHPPRPGAGARARERRAPARQPDRGPAALLGGDARRLPPRRRAGRRALRARAAARRARGAGAARRARARAARAQDGGARDLRAPDPLPGRRARGEARGPGARAARARRARGLRRRGRGRRRGRPARDGAPRRRAARSTRPTRPRSHPRPRSTARR